MVLDGTNRSHCWFLLHVCEVVCGGEDFHSWQCASTPFGSLKWCKDSKIKPDEKIDFVLRYKTVKLLKKHYNKYSEKLKNTSMQTYLSFWSFSGLLLAPWHGHSRAFCWILLSSSSLCFTTLTSDSSSCFLRGCVRHPRPGWSVNWNRNPSSNTFSDPDILLWSVNKIQCYLCTNSLFWFFWHFHTFESSFIKYWISLH